MLEGFLAEEGLKKESAQYSGNLVFNAALGSIEKANGDGCIARYM